MKFIDSHCHFDFDAFQPDRAQIWQRCINSGVTRLIIPGVCRAQWHPLTALTGSQSGWYGAAGIHPWWVAKESNPDGSLIQPEALGWALSDYLNSNHCVAVGECGLDAAIETPIEIQEAVFRVQLEVASEFELPLILHVHRTHNEVLKLLKQFRLPRGGVIHAFSGSEQMAMDYWKMGFYLGIGGTITYARAAKTRRTVSQLPIESLVLESDAPDMPISGRQGLRNSPENLPLIAAELAKLRGVSLQDIADKTQNNTEILFSL
ncbi:TatD family hydrolase [Microbulbifer sp. MLAF003]|uniref:TatD family hydrolase n=1 Tax=Microbulbifer sp. MLAF003 TaxID=3032582 RepID=UPI0024AD3CD4|nr:TatD family hydrolase [Microbulbifer sp. MLAF003]WHI49825.1 TatD family hydrolase [Microbulbifer sp. MLAF003]